MCDLNIAGKCVMVINRFSWIQLLFTTTISTDILVKEANQNPIESTDELS